MTLEEVTSHREVSPDRAPVEIRELHGEDFARWNTFVETHPEGTFFHCAEWKTVIEKAFGHRTYYLYAESAGHIQGVLPLGHLRSHLFGNALMSTPFCVYGGAVAESHDARVALESAAVDLARRLNVDYLELRNQNAAHPNWIKKDLYVTFRKEIDPDPERNMLSIPRKQRRMVRQGAKAGLTSEIDTELDRFYEIYATSVRNLGTPVLPRRYFNLLREIFGDQCEVLTVTLNGRPIASVMSFYFQDTVLPYYGGSLHSARAVAGNDFMYWELMRRACERGFRIFDYGRSKKGTGAYSFKKNWGFQAVPLPYEYLLINATAVPDISPLNPRYRIFVSVWKRLPLSVSKLIGPKIAKYLG
jgi:FemAB-related protein (PEP-CTERM system-associated)